MADRERTRIPEQSGRSSVFDDLSAVVDLIYKINLLPEEGQSETGSILAGWVDDSIADLLEKGKGSDKFDLSPGTSIKVDTLGGQRSVHVTQKSSDGRLASAYVRLIEDGEGQTWDKFDIAVNRSKYGSATLAIRRIDDGISYLIKERAKVSGAIIFAEPAK